MTALMESHLGNMPVKRGKVRDVYFLGEKLLIVASDRISAFDVILPTPIPEKGAILTGLSNYWFNFLPAKHHLLATRIEDFPAELRAKLSAYGEQLAGRAVLVKKTKVIPIECIVRGYITGGGWKEYQKTGAISGVVLLQGLKLCQKLPEPIFTPTTKEEKGHDESITFEEAAWKVGPEVMKFVRNHSIELYKLAAEEALKRGIIIADTKFEWGLTGEGWEPILIDEVLTPDSSRFWPADQYEPGREQASFDKQYVRNYLETLEWNKQAPGPELPEEVVVNTRGKYVEAYEKLTENKFEAV
ncbi:MAG TPA: phosphoribosylaminoimidazolesuccinocarboxamide synthase [Phycisphaerae bacterium]|nr:phosphoribosylaminoimidazolesuccinocarboxamide synthase [Phycisphaerae bacterium]